MGGLVMNTTRRVTKPIYLVIDQDCEGSILPEYNIFAAFDDIKDAIEFMREYKKTNENYSKRISAIPVVINPSESMAEIVKSNTRRDVMYRYNPAIEIDDSLVRTTL